MAGVRIPPPALLSRTQQGDGLHGSPPPPGTSPVVPHRRPLQPLSGGCTLRTSRSPHISGRWRRAGSTAVATSALVLAGLGTAVHATAATPDHVSAKAVATAAPAPPPTPAHVSAKAVPPAVAKAHVQYQSACDATPEKGYAACNALRVTGGTTAFMEKQAALKGMTAKTLKPNASSASPTG